MRKHTFWHMHPMETQISLCICIVLSEFWFSAWRISASLAIQHVPNEDSDHCKNVQADLDPHWVHMSKNIFSDIVAHMVWVTLV